MKILNDGIDKNVQTISTLRNGQLDNHSLEISSYFAQLR